MTIVVAEVCDAITSGATSASSGHRGTTGRPYRLVRQRCQQRRHCTSSVRPVSMIDGWRADGDTGAALAFVIVKPAPMATAATSESRTLRMQFLPRVDRAGREETPHSPASSRKWLLFNNYVNASELPVGGPFIRVVHQSKKSAGLPSRKTRRSTSRRAARETQRRAGTSDDDDAGGGDGGAVMMPVMMVVVMVVPGAPHHAAVACCCGASDDGTRRNPADIVDHVRVDDRRLHRRRRDDGRTGVRRRQRSRRPSSPLRQPGSETSLRI